MRHLGLCVLFFAATLLPAQKSQPKYALVEFDNTGCMAKGRVQDCAKGVMRQILNDGKGAIPVLISQLTDTAVVKHQIADYWGSNRVGDAAFVILADLFADENGHSFSPPEAPNWATVTKGCDQGASNCWMIYLRTHGRSSMKLQWQRAWALHKAQIAWDARKQCFQTSKN